MGAFELVDRLRSLSPAAANLATGVALPFIIPLAGGLGIRVEEVTSTRAVATLPLKRRTRNHVGSVYFGAQMTLAELTMGLLLFKLYPPGTFGVLVKRVEADFTAKAKGKLRAVCELPPAAAEELRKVDLAGSRGKAEAWVPVVLATGDGPVTTARFHVALKRFRPAAP